MTLAIIRDIEKYNWTRNAGVYMEIMKCPCCKQNFTDSYNFISLSALNLCLVCANKDVEKYIQFTDKS